MNIVKKITQVIGLAVAGLVFSASVLANMEAYNAKKDEMIKSLNLTPEQQTQMDALMTKSHEERMTIMKKYESLKGPEKMKAMRPEVEALHAKTQAELAKILDDAQMEKVMEFQDDMMASAKSKMGK